MNFRRSLLLGLGALLAAPAAEAQSVLSRSPNLRPAWTLHPGQAALRIGHRFAILSGGDELFNVPTLTLGVGLPGRAAVGLDFTSNSEIVPGRLGGNELQPWLAVPLLRRSRGTVEVTGAWNSAARSLDGALTAAARAGRWTLLAELRGFQDALGAGEAGAGWGLGAAVRLTPHLELSGDAGGLFDHDALATVWSYGIAMAIPGSPHTLSLQATNGGATTLQGAGHPYVLGDASVRYGFVFTLPLGSARQWGRIFSGGGEGAASVSGAAATVELRMVAVEPREVRIRAGEQVAWINRDPLMHTVSADDRSWGSGPIEAGAAFVHRFERPGRYTYHCIPHPQMTGVVIVE